MLLKILYTIFLMFYYPIHNTVKFFIPYRYRCKSIKNEIALVTGAGSGIGKSLAKKLAKEGAVLVLWDVDETSNNNTKSEIEADGGKAFAFKCDLTQRDEIYKVARKVKQEVGDVSILVNNAGIVSGKTLLECSDAQIERTFQVNTLAHFWTVRSFLEGMLDKNHGHIVTVASCAGLFGVSKLVDYCSSKFGAVGFDDALRSELDRFGKTGIHSTVVCPTGINTGLFAGFNFKGVPMMETEYVTDRILEAILTNQRLLVLPRQIHINIILKALLPFEVLKHIGDLMDANKSMDNFVGRRKED